ncbi:AraC family transcriptional regulator [Rhizobium sp. SIMBA_035]
MQALKDTIAVLGEPVFVRRLGRPTELAAFVARWKHGAAVVDVAPSPTIRLTMSLIDGRDARHWNGSTLADRVRSGSVSIFSPAEGTSVEVTGSADVVQLFVAQSYAQEAIGTPFVCPPMYDLHDERIRSVMMRLLVGSARRGPDDELMIEEDLHGLALQIEPQSRRGSRPSDRRGPPRGGLAPAAFRRVEAMVEAATDQGSSPGLGDMAFATGLSVTHFLRAFRQQTGTTPHKFVVSRRIDRAVSILRLGKASIGEVADQVGYSNPAAFVAAFRGATGVTPGAVRDALR